MNEKFLIRLRDCVMKLSEDHPLKRWMKWAGKTKPSLAEDQKKEEFLNGIINSKFNLITDQKIKNEIISVLHDFPEKTLAESLLKSYFYLMIGNITRSDNILRKVINTPPKENWEKYERNNSFYHRLGSAQASQILQKMAKHPADRTAFELFALYLTHFYNDSFVRSMAKDVDTSEVETKLGLKFIESLAPGFVHYLRFSNMGENRKIRLLRDLNLFPLTEQAYWIWPFLDIDPLVSESMYEGLVSVEKKDELWFIYLMNNEKLADLFSKKNGKSFLPSRRSFLKSNLKDDHTFMLSLYKLIELGDINQDLVMTTVNFITND